MVQLGPQYDLAVRLTELEQRIARMEANGLGQAFSADQSDGSVGMQIKQNVSGSGSTGLYYYQGPNSSRDPNTGMHPLFIYAGEIFVGGKPDDNGMLLYRPDGSQSMVVGNRGAQIFDPKGNQILATDEYGGSPAEEGLTRPYIPLGTPTSTGVAQWPNTAATSMSAIAQRQFIAQHPKVWWVGNFYADSGTTGSVQLTIVNGSGTVASGPTYSVSSNTFGATNDTLTLPSGFWGQTYTVNVNAQVTSGTGKVYCATFNLYGIGNN